MKGRHCRLYDEQLVKHIMISAGLSVYDFIREKKGIDEEDICDFLEDHADSIIEDTIEEMTDGDQPPGESGNTSNPWKELEP